MTPAPDPAQTARVWTELVRLTPLARASRKLVSPRWALVRATASSRLQQWGIIASNAIDIHRSATLIQITAMKVIINSFKYKAVTLRSAHLHRKKYSAQEVLGTSKYYIFLRTRFKSFSGSEN